MKQTGMKIAVYMIAGTCLFAGASFQSHAAGVSNALPVAGLSLQLEEGTSIQNIQLQKMSAKATAINPFTGAIISDIGSAEKVTVSTVLSTTQATLTTLEDAKREEPTTETVIPSPEGIGKTVVPEVLPTVMNSAKDKKAKSAPVIAEKKMSEEEKEFSNMVIAKVNDYVNVRDDADEEAGEVIGKLYDKSAGTLVSEKNGWYEIQSGDVTGYVKAEYVVTGEDAIALAKQVGNRLATVTTTTLKVREQPSQSATVLGLVPIEDELSVLEEMDGWVKVSIEEGEGYVSKEYVDLTTEFVKAESKAAEEARLQREEDERRAARAAAQKATAKSNKKSVNSSKNSNSNQVIAAPGSATGSSLANYATQFVGNPYVYGGTSLTNGTDCSGFVKSVYANYGIALPRSSGQQRSVGADVGGLSNAQPGDIVCYSGHVGIYIGGGNIVHASTAQTGIKISNAGYRNVLSVRRIL
ncbi:MAG: NlpC/P60 family protein [Lachnospiraceae bacterium]